MGTSDRKESGVSIGCTEWVEPLNACKEFWEIAAMQVIWEDKNEPYLSNMEPYNQAARSKWLS